MKEVLNLEIRRSIYNLVEKNQGLHASKIAEILSLSGQLADYHLMYMERNGIIVSIKEEGYRRYYTQGMMGIRDRKRIAILRRETPLKIVLFLLDHPNSFFKEILEHVTIVKSTLSYHLEKLVLCGVISVVPAGNEKRYTVVNERELVDLLIRYKPYSRIESLKDSWVDLKWPGKNKQ
ncbi:MAG: ArsR family transcriptional regulator [Euryarchaeota archaeon]|nr:ArsR family transcriptional regulator [Euryarchaeota archaeon]